MADKKADLAGPGIGNYDDLKHELPDDYEALLSPKYYSSRPIDYIVSSELLFRVYTGASGGR